MNVVLVEVSEGDAKSLRKNKMPRPCKRKRVRGKPSSFYFKPSGIRKINLDESVLEAVEFEALRLKDFLKLSQIECAEKMEVSQPTFHRVVSSAREKVADAIINGKAIRIENG